jgi:hypothetical protein
MADGKVAHRRHELGRFNLACRAHLLQIGKPVDGDVLVLKQCRGLVTDAVEERSLAKCANNDSLLPEFWKGIANCHSSIIV